jgi:hypothetical protein
MIGPRGLSYFHPLRDAIAASPSILPLVATIAWAIAAGLEALETGNDETNAPMRAVNARLGYRPLPDVIGLQGPLAPAG